MSRFSRRTFVHALRMMVILGVMTASLGVMVSRPVSAQQGPDCEDPDTVACIPVDASTPPPSPPTYPSGSAGAAAAPAAPPAIAFPICPPPYPNPVPPPYPPPVPLPAAGQPNAAAPYPVPPYPCFNDVFSTINRGNLAYARAMRSLDAGLLPVYWGQDALRQLRAQIADLRASGSYRVLRLVSIDVLEQAIYPGYAWVHTTERWATATWSFGGYQYDSSDSWYDNQYYLYRAGGGWIIGSDVVN
ncbi:MAG TPA: hypothetical protein VIO16_07000 [Dehalococcoidia bacterium]